MNTVHQLSYCLQDEPLTAYDVAVLKHNTECAEFLRLCGVTSAHPELGDDDDDQSDKDNVFSTHRPHPSSDVGDSNAFVSSAPPLLHTILDVMSSNAAAGSTLATDASDDIFDSSVERSSGAPGASESRSGALQPDAVTAEYCERADEVTAGQDENGDGGKPNSELGSGVGIAKSAHGCEARERVAGCCFDDVSGTRGIETHDEGDSSEVEDFDPSIENVMQLQTSLAHKSVDADVRKDADNDVMQQNRQTDEAVDQFTHLPQTTSTAEAAATGTDENESGTAVQTEQQLRFDDNGNVTCRRSTNDKCVQTEEPFVTLTLTERSVGECQTNDDAIIAETKSDDNDENDVSCDVRSTETERHTRCHRTGC
jgi:hypothetical protein